MEISSLSSISILWKQVQSTAKPAQSSPPKTATEIAASDKKAAKEEGKVVFELGDHPVIFLNKKTGGGEVRFELTQEMKNQGISLEGIKSFGAGVVNAEICPFGLEVKADGTVKIIPKPGSFVKDKTEVKECRKVTRWTLAYYFETKDGRIYEMRKNIFVANVPAKKKCKIIGRDSAHQ
jgi:hypothetical protein